MRNVYARRNPFGAARYDVGGAVSNVGAGGAGPPPQRSASTPWSGTSGMGGGGYGGGKGMGGGGGWGLPGQGGSGMNQNYGPGFGQQQGQGFDVPWGYFNQMQQYNPLLYAGFAGMQPRPWQYEGQQGPAPLFQSHGTWNQSAPPPAQQQQQQPSGGSDGFSILPNFDQNGRIVSIPQGVSWGAPNDGSSPNWIYNGSHTSQDVPNMPGAFGSAGATPLNQYTGTMPPNPYVSTDENPYGATPWMMGQYTRGGAVQGGEGAPPFPSR